ncbi:TetR/AcrR family transcriptional regulator [Pseudonocardia humida]|uniref:TetR family transcriptional regulator n=1 Tax=Pseudonocardia humida TaxID=2800819 RepID=A0ABT1ABN7_9PSEU|nr:TetR family transcriptional regulator [Pseudonocardia humida]MCO1660467.1 TetR family transcriptional regulator [Pseudonocardia humida]
MSITRGHAVTAALSREGIVDAALGLVDRHGLAGLSMRRLGRELGVDPMAVYRHLPDKAALLDGIVDALHAEMDLDSPAGAASWRQELATYAGRVREVLHRHPRAVGVFVTRAGSVDTGNARLADRLAAAGFAARTGSWMVECVRSLTVGLVVAEVVGAAGSGADDDERFRFGLTALLDGFERAGTQAALARPSPRSPSAPRTRPTARR